MYHSIMNQRQQKSTECNSQRWHYYSSNDGVESWGLRAQTFAISLKNGLRRETIAPRGSLCAWDEGSEFLVGWPEVGGFWYMFLGVITEDFGEEVPEVDWL